MKKVRKNKFPDFHTVLPSKKSSVRIHHPTDPVENLVHRADAVDLEIFVLPGVVGTDHFGLLAVDLDAVADDVLRRIVGTARILAAQQDAAHQLLFGDMHVDHERHAQPVPAENLVELLGLNRRAGKAVEDIARRIAVLGSMLELGDYTEEGHRRAGRAAAEHADVLYAYGPSADAIARGAEEKGMKAVHAFTDQNELVEKLRADAKPGDALLFKGSRGMRMERALALFLGEEVE